MNPKKWNLAMTSAAFAVSLAVLEGIWSVFNGWHINLGHPAGYLVLLAAFLITALVALVLMLILGRPALLILRKLDLEQPWEICAVAALLGTVPLVAIWAIRPTQEFPIVQFVVFALAGLIAGVVFVSRTYVIRMTP